MFSAYSIPGIILNALCYACSITPPFTGEDFEAKIHKRTHATVHTASKWQAEYAAGSLP